MRLAPSRESAGWKEPEAGGLSEATGGSASRLAGDHRSEPHSERGPEGRVASPQDRPLRMKKQDIGGLRGPDQGMRDTCRV